MIKNRPSLSDLANRVLGSRNLPVYSKGTTQKGNALMNVSNVAQRLRLIPALLVCASLWPATVVAQDRYFVVDSTTDEVYLFTDLNQDGVIDPVTETRVYYSDASPGPDLSVPNHLLQLGNRLLVADTGTLDAILALEDLNGDGDANDDGEVLAFYDDTAPGLDLSSPNGLALAPDGSVFVADDGASVLAIVRLFDLNGDGDANDDGEATVYYDQSGAGPSIADPESIAVDLAGVVFVGDTATGRIVRMVDSNGDGDALDAGEASTYYEGNSPAALEDLDSLQVDSLGGVYAIDENTGVILYLIDLNSDGDALDSLEATIFLAGAGAGVSDINDAVIIGPGSVLLADGGLDALIRVQDLNASGDIDPSEIVTVFDDMGGILSTPSGIVFVPSMTPPPPQVVAVTPNFGPVAGGTSVSLAGTGLATTTSVSFGGVEAATFAAPSDTMLTVVTPPAAQPGLVDVVVTTPSGTSALVAAFDYLPAVSFVVDAVAPSVGDVSGGTPVTVTGSGWDLVTPIAVLFGGEPAIVLTATPSEIEVITPPHGAGLVDVEVSQGTEQATLVAGFRYQATFVRGDVDGSGAVGIGDAVVLLNYLFVAGTATPSCLDALDLNDDSLLGVDDGLYLLQYLFTSGPAPAPPHPSPGFDSTPGDPGCSG